jgi:putative flippase GtrA
LIFLLLQLMITSGNAGWIVLFAVYGVDAVITIIYRLLNKENIFKAHRSHLYQYLANELSYSHLAVSCFYGLLQLAINILVVMYLPGPTFVQALVVIFGVAILYIWGRERILARLGKKRLMSYLFKTVKE